MTIRTVFECRCCGECCHGKGGIYIHPRDAAGPARLLGLTVEAFIDEYTEPQYGLLSLKTDPEGYCLMLERRRGTCRIHEDKPRMCRDWPFFHGPLNDRDVYEEAKAACPGLVPEATWEEFVEYHRVHVGRRPPSDYFDIHQQEEPDSGD
ncbi:MAG: YkgJ family cysteine cluster protein [Proteobacteria bacterium]|nr:YkgJ family cysteine cluster protein [Pseudomonadota bacterium]